MAVEVVPHRRLAGWQFVGRRADDPEVTGVGEEPFSKPIRQLEWFDVAAGVHRSRQSDRRRAIVALVAVDQR